jgi:hypothetical protein
MSALGGKKTLGISPFLFFFIYLCFSKAEDPGTYWIANLWKAYEHPAVLNPVPVNVCLEKSSTPFLPIGRFQSCLHKSADPTGEQHAPHATLLPIP